MPPVSPESQAQLAAYDAQPYHGRPCTDSHPSRMAVVAKLAGLKIPDVEHCRVLEIACGDGNNLIAIAESLPGAQCLGIDLSGRHIAMGQAGSWRWGSKHHPQTQADLLAFAPAKRRSASSTSSRARLFIRGCRGRCRIGCSRLPDGTWRKMACSSSATTCSRAGA